mmetsp:Transcript_68301/g.220915  ORF Transcript_68301/g.220915 Transcript_68301/m.220915 type:complete len:272 (-) Transcript_68301:1209-2024(-)
MERPRPRCRQRVRSCKPRMRCEKIASRIHTIGRMISMIRRKRSRLKRRLGAAPRARRAARGRRSPPEELEGAPRGGRLRRRWCRGRAAQPRTRAQRQRWRERLPCPCSRPHVASVGRRVGWRSWSRCSLLPNDHREHPLRRPRSTSAAAVTVVRTVAWVAVATARRTRVGLQPGCPRWRLTSTWRVLTLMPTQRIRRLPDHTPRRRGFLPRRARRSATHQTSAKGMLTSRHKSKSACWTSAPLPRQSCRDSATNGRSTSTVASTGRMSSRD